MQWLNTVKQTEEENKEIMGGTALLFRNIKYQKRPKKLKGQKRLFLR